MAGSVQPSARALSALSLFATLYQTELARKRLDMRLKELAELLA